MKLAALRFLFTAAVSHAADAKPFNFPRLKQDIEFAKAGGVSLTLDAFVPEGSGPFATCILVHGGGFTKGDKHSFITPLFEPLARAGFTWFAINCRLAPQHRHPQRHPRPCFQRLPANLLQAQRELIRSLLPHAHPCGALAFRKRPFGA